MAGYCVEADVVSYAQTASDYTASTTPTQTQVEAFIDRRAGEIHAWMASTIGEDSAPGPSGYGTTIDTTTDRGLTLSRVCTQANAIGAAMDALEAAGASEGPARSERIAELMAMYYGGPGIEGSMRESVMIAAKAYQGASDDSATHFTTGEITSATIVGREEEGLQFTGETDW